MIDRNVEFPNRFRMTKVEGTDDIYDLIPAPGEVIAPGDTFSKANMLPDSITALLGLKMANPQVKDALNVLAHVGNLHVWKRVQTYAEPVPEVPAGYTLGPVETDTLIVTGTSSTRYIYFYTATSPTVDNNGNVSIPTTTTQSSYKVSVLGDSGKTLNGPFFFVLSSDTVGIVVSEVVYIPAGATMYCDSSYTKVYISKLQRVTGYPYTPAIPAGTTTDHLTSTDRNAYPDQSAEGGEPEKPAHYTLGEAETVDVLSSSADYTATLYSCDLDSVLVNNYGSISTTNFSVERGGKDIFTSAGSWASFSPTKAYYITSGSDNVVFTDTVFTVSEENTLTYSGGKYILQGCRKLIGHAKVEAIPANTAITYLGQLGGGARIEVGSYVGTGTYGRSNPNSLTASFPIKIAIIGNYKSGSTDVSATAIFLPMGCNTTFNKHGYFFSDYDSAMQDQYKYSRISKDGKTLYWYDSRYAKDQLNVSTRIYFYVLIG